MIHISLIAALTADGHIARDTAHAADWTSREDKKLFVEITKRAGTIVMGSATFSTIGRELPGRTIYVLTSRTDHTPHHGVIYTNEQPRELVKRLESEGVKQLVVCGGARVYGDFLQAGLVRELYLTVEPCLFGTGIQLSQVTLDVRLSLIEVRPLSEQVVLLHYLVLK